LGINKGLIIMLNGAFSENCFLKVVRPVKEIGLD